MEYQIQTYNHCNLSRFELYTDSAMAEINELLRRINPETSGFDSQTGELFFGFRGFLVLATDISSGRIIGVATLVLVHKINSVSARVEHVAVLPEYGRKGIGRALVSRIVEEAETMGLTKVDLTCEPFRFAANELYGKLGFKKRDTNCRRLKLPRP